MTQKSELLPLSLQLLPMQMPEARLGSDRDYLGEGSNILNESAISTSVSCNLLLHPGEFSEIVVKLENLTNRSLQLSLRIEGDFPPHWCSIGMEGNELLPRAQMESVLHFQVPSDFFEAQDALPRNQNLRQTLTLDYTGQLFVYANQPNTNPVLVDIAPFNLYLRPHSLYLNFLPDIYRDIDFIGRLLKVFEQSYEPSVQQMDALWAYLDPLTTPDNLLPFLAHWVGWQFIPTLSQERQRSLIKQAMEIYCWRGTRKGLRFYLHLFTGLPLDDHLPETEKHISITEVSGKGFLMGESSIGQDTMVGGGKPFHFIVRIHNDLPTSLDRNRIIEIVEQEKPAFCTYELYITGATL
ncbi:phage tail protein [Tumidithrix elongata RA019]|uniref:Phage tail protein n=1 Tax=Tumidithrix elongata BACA0141 TaxID=2716417 RepID=A0AAW9Q4K1_9CYAN|nr:phage tail protein [Tumidithrix elongata RA019]